jgi:hypothetical protein
MSNALCLLLEQPLNSFPCSASAIEAMSLGLATGCISLLFTFWLFKKVRVKGHDDRILERYIEVVDVVSREVSPKVFHFLTLVKCC